MKINHSNEAWKFIELMGIGIITCILIGIGIYMADSSKRAASDVNIQLTSYYNEIYEADIMKYDRLEVTGSDVVNFIKKHLGDYNSSETGPFTIKIVTNIGQVNHTNSSNIDYITNFTHAYYIKPTASFKGYVTKNQNGVITEIKFQQQ